MRLVLASTSPYRNRLLGRLGIPFEACAPDLDEAPFKDRGLAPEELVRTLAREKARSLTARFPGALILGGDQAAEIDSRILDKPGTAARAREQLRLLSGRTHRLLTAVALLRPGDGRLEEALEIHALTLRALSDAQIARYVEVDSPLDCAGSYRIEGAGIALFREIRGGDPTAIEGLPLTRVMELLSRMGFDAWPTTGSR